MAEGAVFDAQAVTDAVAEGIAKIENASTMEELKAIKTQYAGAESAMTQASKAIGALPKDQKKDAGKLMGKLRADFGRAFGTKEKQVKAEEEARELAAETVDMTLPVNRKPPSAAEADGGCRGLLYLHGLADFRRSGSGNRMV